jgi:hypothetical protein
MAQSKTTIRNIDPDTLWDAKIYAAQTKQTIGEVITLALDRLIAEEEEDK